MWWCLHDGIKNRGSTHKSGVSETQSWADGPELRPLNHIGDRPKGDRREFAVSSAKRDYPVYSQQHILRYVQSRAIKHGRG